jgi:alpha-L-rhamnosidase
MYGPTASSWEIAEGQFRLDVTVPPNARATVRLPHAALEQVTEGGRVLRAGNGVASAVQAGESVIVEVGSGRYRFAYGAWDSR